MLQRSVWIMIGFLFLSRFLVHPWNFSPVLALFMFAGQRGLRSWLPLMLALVLSDLILGFAPTVLAGYAVYALVALVSERRRVHWLPLTLSSSVVFFLVSNFAVWAGATMYPMTPAGLMSCYAAAVPFFGNTLMGNLFYSYLIFVALPRVLPKPATA